MSHPTLLAVRDLRVTYRRSRLRRKAERGVAAVDGVSFDVPKSESIALVGESGSGKTTVARAITGLVRPDSGSITFNGTELGGGRSMRASRGRLQMIFQNHYASLNPRRRVEAVLSTAVRLHHRVSTGEARLEAQRLLSEVGLDASLADRYPSQLSGGQRQRVAIARALASAPDLIVCDEPLTSLDMFSQAQIARLLTKVQQTRGVSYLVIAHDLAFVRHFCHRYVVMYAGVVVEIGKADLYEAPAHPYTRALLDLAPRMIDERREDLETRLGAHQPARPAAHSGGCRYASRCPRAQDLCEREEPRLNPVGSGGRWAACHFPLAGSETERVPATQTSSTRYEAG